MSRAYTRHGFVTQGLGINIFAGGSYRFLSELSANVSSCGQCLIQTVLSTSASGSTCLKFQQVCHSPAIEQADFSLETSLNSRKEHLPQASFQVHKGT